MARNNHYHYAEKFDDKRRSRAKLFVPRRTLFIAALFLLIFGLISTTFAAYVSSNQPEATDDGHSILIDVRTAKAERDIALTGASADIAATGYDVTSGAIIYFDATGWDTSTYSKVQIMIGHGTYSTCYTMTRVGSTNLYYYTMPSWSGFTQMCFIANSSEWGAESGSGHSPNDRKIYAHHYTNTWGSGNITNTKHLFKKASSSNNANLTEMNDSNYNTLLNSTFHLYVATKKGSGSYDSSDNAGGTATMSGTTKTTSNATSTTTFSTNADGDNYPMIGSAVTLSQSTTSGYTFVKYVFDSASESSTQTGSPINMTSAKNETTTVFALYKENMHSVKITNNIDNTSTTESDCIGVATTKQFTAPSKAGYTFSSWTVPTGMTITSGSTTSSTITVKSTASASATLTLRANYTINPPTNVSISDKTMKVGDSAVSLNPQYTIPSGMSAVVNYTIEDENGNTVSSSVASVNSSGNFTATIPGEYTVTISVAATDGTQTSTAVTDTATVIVSPAIPQWTLTMNGYDEGTGTENDPFVVSLGSNFSFTAAITNPPNDNNYVYTWYNGDNEVLGTGRTLNFGAATASEATTASVHVEVYCVVSYTGASPTATSGRLEKWYIIKSLIKSFEIPDMQKIYASPNDAKMAIEYNITNPTGYDTSLYFSSDNVTFYQVDVAHGAFLGSQIGATAVYEYNPASQMSPEGPKYFYLAMSKTGVSAKTDVIHTTVGADSAVQNRPVYFINNIGSLDLSTYRVMAFYIDGNGDLKYQTAQDVYKGITGKTENQRFRVMIPSDATKISFAVAKKTKYDIPADDTNAPDYDNDFFYAYTNYVTLSDNYNTVKANAMSNQESDPDEDPLYLMTTQYLTYQTTN